MQHSKAITKKLKDEIFIWDPTAYSNKGYWYVLGTTGAFGRPASKAESKKLGKPPVAETEPVAPEVLDEAPQTKEPKKGSKSDEYRQAKRDSGTPLGEMIFKKWFEEGEGLGSAIKGSISDKFKAKVAGIKEKFDPLNIAKGVFGKKIGAVIGRKMGRDDEDIEHFTGYRNKTVKDVDTATKIGDLEKDSPEDALYTKVSTGKQTRVRTKESVANVLTKLYNLIKGHHELEIKEAELHKKDQKLLEEKRNQWNKELIEALTGKKAEVPPLKITDFNKFHEDLVKKLKQMAEAIKEGGGKGGFIDKKLDKIKTKVGSKIAAKFAGKQVAKTIAKKIGAKEIGEIAAKKLPKILAKSVAKKIPLLSIGAGLAFAASRLADGDIVGAAAEAGSGIVGTIPGVGTAASITADIAIAARDIYTEAFGISPEKDPQSGERMKLVKQVIESQLKPHIEKEGAKKPEEEKEKTPTATKVDETKKEPEKNIPVKQVAEEVKKKETSMAKPMDKKEESKTSPMDKKEESKTSPASPSSTNTPSKEEKSDAEQVKAPPGPTAKAEPVDSTKSPMAAQTISQNAETRGVEGSKNGAMVVADNSQKTNIINQYSDGLLVEQLTGVRTEESTLQKIMKQNIRMV